MSENPGLRTKLHVHVSAALACLLVVICAAFGQVEAPVRPPAATTQAPQKTGFRAVSYEVFASLNPENQMITARVIVEFEAQSASRAVECELHPNLSVSDVRDAAGKVLEIDRGGQNGLDLDVSLPDVVPAGQRIKLTFSYSGVLANEENSPISGARLASIGKDGAYLLLPARWFPLTDYPANRFTGVFHIEVPQNFAVAGTGTASAPGPPQSMTMVEPVPISQGGPPVPARRNPNAKATASPAPRPEPSVPPAAMSAPPADRIEYTFRVDRPEAAGTFVAGALQLAPIKAEGLSINVYTSPATATSAEAYGDAVARVITTLTDSFGPLPQPSVSIAQLPDGSLPTFSAPGLLLVSQRQWAAKPDERALSNLVASQWWGQEVTAASASDVWLTDGLSRYAEALYLEQST